MVLGQIKFQTGGISFGQGLSSGIDPNSGLAKVDSQVKRTLTQAGKIPSKAGGQAALNAHSKAQYMEEQKQIISEVLEGQTRQMNAALDYRDEAIKFVMAKQAGERRYQKQSQTLQKAQLKHNLATGILQAESVGMQKAYKETSAFDLL